MLKITPIFNIPYSPQYNWIETYFSLLKCEYKKLILQKVIRKEPVNAITLIQMAEQAVDQEKIKKCVKYGFDCIDKSF